MPSEEPREAERPVLNRAEALPRLALFDAALVFVRVSAQRAADEHVAQVVRVGRDMRPARLSNTT